MLLSLHVKNFAIIDEIWLDFSEGLNVLTGETGAGKSILIGSIGAALGAKVSKDILGKNADYALVELTFECDNPELKKLFLDNDLIYEDDQIVISRRIQANGRSVCRINGETVTQNILKEIAGLLIDIHGQHEHQSLLYSKKQRETLDAMNKEILTARDCVARDYEAYKEALEALDLARESGRKSERELELLRYGVEEILAAKLKPNEDVELEERFKILQSFDKIAEGLKQVDECVSSGRNNAQELIDQALRSMSHVSNLDEKLESLFERLNTISEELRDFGADTEEYLNNLSEGAEEYTEISERLDVINKLKHKYGNTIEKILATAEQDQKTLDSYDDFDAYLTKLEKELETKENVLKKSSEKLTKLRMEEAKKQSAMIEKALESLNFSYAKFEIRLEPTSSYTRMGREEVHFYISTNLGEELRKVSECASGGELSRVMLAIKSVVALENSIDSLIFDEIDTGISGRTAQKVSEKMALLAGSHQLICITHLPQIASMADTHFLIEKHEEAGKTVTDISRLDFEESVIELSRMLSGSAVTEAVKNNAREMLSLAQSLKATMR